MKKITFHILLASTASLLVAQAQTNIAPPAGGTNPPAVGLSLTSASASVPATNLEMTATTNGLITPTNVTPALSPPVPAPAAAGIPLIQFADVPITTAIENLARQAGINYMLDPKIGYGLPDASGQIKAEPNLSIRWENISAENALIALLDNYGLQLTRDKKTEIARISPKDPLAPPPLITRVVQLKYSSVSNMMASVQSAFTDKRSKVLADNRTSQIVVTATDPEQQAVDTLVAQLDKPTKQVLIETKLVEISSQPSTKKGVDWTSTLSSQNIKFGNGKVSGTTTITSPGATTTTQTYPGGPITTATSPNGINSVLTLLQGGGGFSASTVSGLIPTTGFLNADGVSAVLSFLNSTYDAQIVSTPRIVTLDNETAKISVTRTYPIIQIGAGTQQSSGSSSVTYSNVGTILTVTPRISANDFIWLKVAPEVSSHFSDYQVTVAGGGGNASTSFPIPIFDSRSMESQVLIPNGNTLVMGGLIQDNPTASYTKVPLLGDIPGLGWAFRSENKSMSKDNLIIFLTPTIIKSDDFTPTPTDFLKSKTKLMKSPMNPNRSWDSAQPRGNWSNPAPQPNEFDLK